MKRTDLSDQNGFSALLWFRFQQTRTASSRGIICVLAAILLGGCGAHVYHRVRDGETLYTIGWRYGQDYRQIAEWNNIPPPYVIYKGQVLRVAPPVEPWWESRRKEGESGLAGNDSNTSSAKAENSPPKRPTATAKADLPEPSLPAASSVVWRWPTTGPLVKTFSADPPYSKGVDIGGRQGQPVYAAAGGRVVYSGSGLIGYGKLIIIKHNKTFLSAYAYNDQLLVQEGDDVREGQEIAKMGRIAGTNEARLHFEIRRNGKPVDPLQFLEKQGS